MPSLAEIRAGLRWVIEDAIPSLTGYEKVPESVNVPAFLIVPTSTNFAGAFGRGADTYSFDLIVLVSRADDELAQEALDDYVSGAGDKSIREAIWRSKGLGLGVDAFVTGMTGYGASQAVGSTDYAGATLAVEVLTSGTA